MYQHQLDEIAKGQYQERLSEAEQERLARSTRLSKVSHSSRAGNVITWLQHFRHLHRPHFPPVWHGHHR